MSHTVELSAAQEGCYWRLVCWCYLHRKPLPLDIAECYGIARAHNGPTQLIVRYVLNQFFNIEADGRHSARVDLELDSVSYNTANGSACNRTRRYRAKRASILNELETMGVYVRHDATMSELCALRDASRDGARDVTETGEKLDVRSKNTLSSESVSGARANREGEACKAMKAAGFASVNPSDPRLTALLDGGVTVDELAAVAVDAVQHAKGWAWLLATVKGRRDDAARISVLQADPTAGGWAPMLGRQEVDR